jgi:hypothetical protein
MSALLGEVVFSILRCALVRRPLAGSAWAIADEEGLAGQLAAPGYHVNTGGKLVIESKAEMAKRGVASRDDADALALTSACGVAPEAVVAEPTYWRPPPVLVSRNSWLG